MSCYQLTVSGGGSASPALVKFPGAYAASDPGILINIHAPMSTYVDRGPTVYSGGQLVIPKNTCSGLSASPTGPLKTGTPYTPGSGGSSTTTTAPAGGSPTTTMMTSTTSKAPSQQPTTTTSAATGGCTVAKYGQCGGTGFTGCTTCAVSYLLLLYDRDQADVIFRLALPARAVATTTSASRFIAELCDWVDRLNHGRVLPMSSSACGMAVLAYTSSLDCNVPVPPVIFVVACHVSITVLIGHSKNICCVQ